MYALVTIHRDVIVGVVIGPDVDSLKTHVRQVLGASTPPLRWTNYLSHWGIVTTDGLTSHTIHPTTEVKS